MVLLQAKQVAAAQLAAGAGDNVAALANLEIDDELDAGTFHLRRMQWVTDLKAKGQNPYPHKFHVSLQLPAFIKT